MAKPTGDELYAALVILTAHKRSEGVTDVLLDLGLVQYGVTARHMRDRIISDAKKTLDD